MTRLTPATANLLSQFAAALLLLQSVQSLAPAAEAPAAPDKPNILMILIDDLGWKDVGYNGSPICRTPNIDRLASQGMRFSQAYSGAPICSASRAALLTGRSPARLHLEFVTQYPDEVGPPLLKGTKLKNPPYTSDLPLEEVTIPEVLKSAGYTTAFFGKWHVSSHHERYLGWSPTHGPKQQGFDVAEEDFGGHTYNKEGQARPESYKPGEYPPDSMTDRAIAFLQKRSAERKASADKGRPFYLQVNHFYVHTPVNSQADWLTQQYAALPASQDRPKRHVEYAAFVDIMDHHVGRLLDALEASGLAKDTLVVLTSDNGGDPQYTQHAPLRGHKWTLYEGGIRVPMIMRWPSHAPAGIENQTPVINTDLLPTFAQVAGAKLDPAVTLDGVSLLPLLSGSGKLAERTLLWHFPYYHPEKFKPEMKRTVGTNDPEVPFLEPQSAVRVGKYKLIRFWEREVDELYDLEADLGEQHDLSAKEPARFAEMKAALRQKFEETKARLPVKRTDE